VIGLPNGFPALGDLGVVGLVAGPIRECVVEAVDRAHAGDAPPRIQAGTVGRPVEIDHIARIGRDEHRGTERVGEDVEPLKVPVGVGHVLRFGARAAGELRGQMGADMRHRDQ
jgi:hypothetical protein